MRYKGSYLLLLTCVIGFFFHQPSANAAKVVDFYDFLSTVSLGAPANHTITFATPSGVNSPSDNIDIYFGTSTDGYHFDLSAIAVSDVSLAIDDDSNCDGPYTYKTLAASAGVDTWGLAIDSANYRLNFNPPTNSAAGEIASGRCVQVMAGKNVAGGTNQIINPNLSDGIRLDVSGAFGDFGTVAVLIFNDNKVNITAEVNDSSFATTTPTTTPPTVSAGGWSVTFTDAVPPEISNFRIDNITTSSVKVSWNSNEPVNCSLKFGKSYFYEIGNQIQSAYATSCAFNLANLQPATNYLFRAISIDRSGNQTVTDSNFSTKVDTKKPDVPEIYIIENVTKFEIIPSQKNMLLVWERPHTVASRNVMILRSEDFFPTGRSDGDLIYFGLEPAAKNGKIKYLDIKGLSPYKYYYYNIISLDQAGHESSGALNFASLLEPANDGQPARPGEVKPLRPDIPRPESQPMVPTSTNQAMNQSKPLSIGDFLFIKNGDEVIDNENGAIMIDNTDSLLVAIKKNLLSSTTRRLIANLISKRGSSLANFQYNNDGSFYANFDNLEAGEHQLIIGIYDENNVLTEAVKGSVNIQLNDAGQGITAPVKKPLESIRQPLNIRSLVVGLLSLLFAILLILAKKKLIKKEER